MTNSNIVSILFKKHLQVLEIKNKMENNPDDVNLLDWWDCENAEIELKRVLNLCIEYPYKVEKIFDLYDQELIETLISNAKTLNK